VGARVKFARQRYYDFYRSKNFPRWALQPNLQRFLHIPAQEDTHVSKTKARQLTGKKEAA